MNEDEKVGARNALNVIGNVYHRQAKYEAAIEYRQKALSISRALGDKEWIGKLYGNIGLTYQEMGRYNEALSYKKQSLKIAQERGDKTAITVQTGNIGDTYASLKKYDSALMYEFRAIRIDEALDFKQDAGMNYSDIGDDYYRMARDHVSYKPDSLMPAGREALLDASVRNLRKGIGLIRESGTKELLDAYTLTLAQALELKGDNAGALAAYKNYLAIKDSIFNIANNERIANLETKRAVELKDKDIQIAKLAVAKKRNERGLFMAVIGLMMGVMGLLFGNYKKQQRSARIVAREKERSDDLLLNILPAEVAEELKTSGGAQARQFDAVTVLFTDFVNFTGTAEQLSPQVLVKELHECFTAFDAIMERHGLEKIKTVGDTYIAVGGLPNADARHAQHCVQAALDILGFMEQRGRTERVFGIRIGINSGPVVAGIVGVKKFAYDIWGDTVNTAARMEQHGEPGRINISQSTYELVKEDYRCDYRGKVAAKNKGDVAMYFVEAANTAITNPRLSIVG